jgi:tetratricopeptide (TPR) repeat protein
MRALQTWYRAAMSRGLAVLSVIVVMSLAASSALAQTNPLIERGEQEYNELRFEEALQTLSAALVRTGNSREDQARIYRLLAFTYLALRREEEAAGAYRSMLSRDPTFEPGAEQAPRIRTFFAQVRQQWEADGRPGAEPPPPVSIGHRSPPQTERGQAVELAAEVEDPASRVDRLVLAYRQGTQAVFQRIDAQRAEGRFVATIPAGAVAPPLVEYYFEALDAQGLPIAARGDVAAPLRIAVPAPGGGSVADEWWFWTIIGTVVVGAVVAGIVIANEVGSSQQPSGILIINVE